MISYYAVQFHTLSYHILPYLVIPNILSYNIIPHHTRRQRARFEAEDGLTPMNGSRSPQGKGRGIQIKGEASPRKAEQRRGGRAVVAYPLFDMLQEKEGERDETAVSKVGGSGSRPDEIFGFTAYGKQRHGGVSVGWLRFVLLYRHLTLSSLSVAGFRSVRDNVKQYTGDT